MSDVLRAKDGHTVVKKLMANASWLLGANTFTTFIGLVQGLLVAKALGVETFGVLATITSLTTAVNQIVDSRVWETVINYYSKFIAESDESKARSLVKLSVLIDLFTASLATLLVLGFAEILSRYFMKNTDAALPLQIFSLTLVASFPKGTFSALLRISNRFNWLAAKDISISTIRFLLIVVGLYFTTNPLLGVTLAYVVAAIVESVLVSYMVFSERKILKLQGTQSAKLSVLKGHRKEIFRFLFFSNSIAFTKLLQHQAGPLLTAFLIGPVAVGHFQIAKKFSDLLLFPLIPLNASIYPEFSRLWHQNDIPLLKKTFVTLSLLIGLFGIVGGVCFMLAGKLLITSTVGTQYLPSLPTFYLLVLATTLQTGFLCFPQLLRAMGRMGISFIANICCVSVFVVVLWLTLPRLGLIGVGVAQLALTGVWIIITFASVVIAFRGIQNVNSTRPPLVKN